MRVGTRRSAMLASGYEKNEMHDFAQAFTEATPSILDETGIDLYGNTRAAMLNTQAYDAMKRFFIEGSYDPKEYENDPEALEEFVEDMDAQFENDKEGLLENTSINSVNPVIGMTFPRCINGSL